MPGSSTLVALAAAALLLAIAPVVGHTGAVSLVIALAAATLCAPVSRSAAQRLRSGRRFAVDRCGAATIFAGLGVSSALAHPARH